MSESDLSKQRFSSLWSIFFHRQRVKDLLGSLICFAIAVIFIVAYILVDKSTPGFWKELAPFMVPAFVTFSFFFFVLAYWRSPLAFARGEPEDSEIVSECLKRCVCVQESSESINLERPSSRTDHDNTGIGSMRNWSIPFSNLRNRVKQARMEATNLESDDSVSGIWTRLQGICCQKSSNREASANTTENRTLSRTDPTDTISISQEEIEMVVMNPGQQGLSLSQQSPSDVMNSADSGKSTCIESPLSCQNPDLQEPTELTQSSIGSTDCSISLSKDIEMDDGHLMQKAASGFSEKKVGN